MICNEYSLIKQIIFCRSSVPIKIPPAGFELNCKMNSGKQENGYRKQEKNRCGIRYLLNEKMTLF